MKNFNIQEFVFSFLTLKLRFLVGLSIDVREVSALVCGHGRLPNIRMSWDYHLTFMLISGRVKRINGTGNFWNIESYSAVRYNREKVDGELFK